MPTYLSFVALLIPLGLCQMTLLNAANATMQLGVDPVMRGRVMALYMAVLMGGTPIGAPLIGALAEAFGARWSLIAGGLISVVRRSWRSSAGPSGPGRARRAAPVAAPGPAASTREETGRSRR